MRASVKSLALLTALGLTVTLSACTSAAAPDKSSATSSASQGNPQDDTDAALATDQRSPSLLLLAIKKGDFATAFALTKADSHVAVSDLIADAKKYAPYRLDDKGTPKSWEIISEVPRTDGIGDTGERIATIRYTTNTGKTYTSEFAEYVPANVGTDYLIENMLPYVNAGLFIVKADGSGLKKYAVDGYDVNDLAPANEKVYLIDKNGKQTDYTVGEARGNLLPGTYKFRITADIVGTTEDPNTFKQTSKTVGTFDQTFTATLGLPGQDS
jgi:hypothetical protein